MRGELTLANGRLVLRDTVIRGAVHVVNGVIMGITAGRAVSPGAIDVDGDYLVPGLVELHTDVFEGHAFPRPGVAWPPVAAAVAYDGQLIAAGITTVLDSLAIGYVFESGRRPRDPRPFVDALRAASEQGLMRGEHFLHLRCEVSTEQVVDDFQPLAGDPRVRLVSLMDHTPGQRQYVDVSKYRLYNQGKYGLTDDQIDALITRRLVDQARFGEKHRAAIIELCHKHGHALASHDDATRAHVEEAAEAGTVIAEFPTTLEAAAAAHDFHMAVLAGAPNLVLGKSHSGNITVAALAQAGTLDILSSDYVPASLLHGAFVLHALGLPLHDAMATITATPATRVGLIDRGALAPGLRGDLVRVRATPAAPVVKGVWRAGVRVG
jgi:alpha-D-ribose 1-methylphosphonate 5-triphosphate diphosphatase